MCAYIKLRGSLFLTTTVDVIRLTFSSYTRLHFFQHFAQVKSESNNVRQLPRRSRGESVVGVNRSSAFCIYDDARGITTRNKIPTTRSYSGPKLFTARHVQPRKSLREEETARQIGNG